MNSINNNRFSNGDNNHINTDMHHAMNNNKNIFNQNNYEGNGMHQLHCISGDGNINMIIDNIMVLIFQ